jgi:hypothetical protein
MTEGHIQTRPLKKIQVVSTSTKASALRRNVFKISQVRSSSLGRRLRTGIKSVPTPCFPGQQARAATPRLSPYRPGQADVRRKVTRLTLKIRPNPRRSDSRNHCICLTGSRAMAARICNFFQLPPPMCAPGRDGFKKVQVFSISAPACAPSQVSGLFGFTQTVSGRLNDGRMGDSGGQASQPRLSPPMVA